jgi:hypothetical protein
LELFPPCAHAEITSECWSFALQHAVRVHNSAPRKEGQTLSPYALFTGEDAPQWPTDFRVLFFPVYVLEKELQDNKSKPKWTNCSYQGIDVGHPPHHASDVVLVYDPATKLVSPQYHVIFYEDFTTVLSRYTDEQKINNINNLLGNTLADTTWSHSDKWTDAAEHFYFFSNWDLKYQEFLKQQDGAYEARREATSYSRKRIHNDIQTRDNTVSKGASVSFAHSLISDKCSSKSHGHANTTDTTSKIPSSQLLSNVTYCLS